MLFYETIDAKTLELLKKLQKVPEFADLRLAGGTALALQIGHRKSIDLHLFGNIDTDYLTILNRLNEVGAVTVLKKSTNINIFIIDGVKVDIVNYPYKWIEKPLFEDEIILADKKDIAAMKLSAITGRGTKKDFIDFFFLLHQYDLRELLDFYNQKYHDGSLFLVLKSLSYFKDADTNEDPFMLKSAKWVDVKAYIKEILSNYIKK